MKDKKIRELIAEVYPEENIYLFDNHAYDKSIIGISEGDSRAIYSYEKMIEEFAEDENCDEMDAIEWIEYNTLRALPYLGDKAPIVIHELKEML